MYCSVLRHRRQCCLRIICIRVRVARLRGHVERGFDLLAGCVGRYAQDIVIFCCVLQQACVEHAPYLTTCTPSTGHMEPMRRTEHVPVGALKVKAEKVDEDE